MDGQTDKKVRDHFIFKSSKFIFYMVTYTSQLVHLSQGETMLPVPNVTKRRKIKYCKIGLEAANKQSHCACHRRHIHQRVKTCSRISIWNCELYLYRVSCLFLPLNLPLKIGNKQHQDLSKWTLFFRSQWNYVMELNRYLCHTSVYSSVLFVPTQCVRAFDSSNTTIFDWLRIS